MGAPCRSLGAAIGNPYVAAGRNGIDHERVVGLGAASLDGRQRAEPASLGDNFEAGYTGTITRSSGARGAETLEFDTTLDNPSGSSLVIVLRGTDNGSGLTVEGGTATITSQGAQSLFDGDITSIRGDTLVATPTAGSASSSTIAIAIDSLDNATQRVSGTVRTTEARER